MVKEKTTQEKKPGLKGRRPNAKGRGKRTPRTPNSKASTSKMSSTEKVIANIN